MKKIDEQTILDITHYLKNVIVPSSIGFHLMNIVATLERLEDIKDDKSTPQKDK